MKIFIKSFLWILVLMLTLLTDGIIERVLYILFGLLCYSMMGFLRETGFKYFKKIFCGIFVGYLIANVVIFNNSYEIKYNEFKNYGIGNNKTAVVLLFDIDSSQYRPEFFIKNFKKFNTFLDSYKLPFGLFKNKLLSEKLSENMNSYYSKLLKENLQRRLGEEYRVYNSYTNQSPYIEETIQEARKKGYGQIVVTPISLVGTEMMESHHDVIQGTRFQIENTVFKSTNYLWDSELMIASYGDKINGQIQTSDKSRVGIILVGEPLNKKTENEIFIKQDILFREKVSNLLKEEGYDHNKIRLSFLNKKLIKEEIEGLMEYGVGQIMIVHTSNESQKNSSLVMVKKLIESLEIPPGIKMTQIYGWTPDEYILTELLKRIELVKYKSN